MIHFRTYLEILDIPQRMLSWIPSPPARRAASEHVHCSPRTHGKGQRTLAAGQRVEVNV